MNEKENIWFNAFHDENSVKVLETNRESLKHLAEQLARIAESDDAQTCTVEYDEKQDIDSVPFQEVRLRDDIESSEMIPVKPAVWVRLAVSAFAIIILLAFAYIFFLGIVKFIERL